MTDERGLTYADAGVDLDAAEAAVERIKPLITRATRPEVLGGIGGFGGLFALDLARHRDPILVSATDGVGTKLEIARALARPDTVGIDLVAMVVDDLVVSGAEPLFFLDYLAVERLEPELVERLVAGVAEGCRMAGCALVGGETAEHPGVMRPGSYDLAGFGVGVVERDALLGPQQVRPGDAVVALASSGLHSNGYSLVRRIVADLDLSEPHGLAEPLADALLRPTRIYAPDCLALAAAVEVHAFCHVTGGGVPGNLPRALPQGLGAAIDAQTFPVPPVIGWLANRGQVQTLDLWRTFNMGAGMLALVPDADATLRVLTERGIEAWQCGTVTDCGHVEIVGMAAHPAH